MENHSAIKGKIVLVPFPFDDLSATKVRPAICLTEPIGPHDHIVLAFVSSRIPQDLQVTDIVLDSNNPDFALTGLRVSSIIMLHRLMTVTTALIRRELGKLSPQLQLDSDEKLMELFGLTYLINRECDASEQEKSEDKIQDDLSAAGDAAPK